MTGMGPWSEMGRLPWCELSVIATIRNFLKKKNKIHAQKIKIDVDDIDVASYFERWVLYSIQIQVSHRDPCHITISKTVQNVIVDYCIRWIHYIFHLINLCGYWHWGLATIDVLARKSMVSPWTSAIVRANSKNMVEWSSSSPVRMPRSSRVKLRGLPPTMKWKTR